METSLCFTCNQKIYIKNIIDGHRPAIFYKNKYYCNECIEAVYFCEDLENNDDIKLEVKPIKTEIKSLILCPFCKNNIPEGNQKCIECDKIHPLYIHKKKKKRKKKK